MTDGKWTPGPWTAEPQAGRGAWIKGSTGEWVALSCGDTDERARDNAHLIVAAPKLYEEGIKTAAILRVVAYTLKQQYRQKDLAEELIAEEREIQAVLAEARGEKGSITLRTSPQGRRKMADIIEEVAQVHNDYIGKYTVDVPSPDGIIGGDRPALSEDEIFKVAKCIYESLERYDPSEQDTPFEQLPEHDLKVYVCVARNAADEMMSLLKAMRAVIK